MELYSYIGAVKYLGWVKICPLAHPGGAGLLYVNFAPLIISETTGARKLKLKTQLDVVKYSLWVQKIFPLGGVQGCWAP